MFELMTLDVKTLHEIERKLIKALTNGKFTLNVLTQQTGLNIDQVRRGIEWLKYKNLINVNEKTIKFLSLGIEGIKAIEKDLPERILVNVLNSLGEVQSIPNLKLACKLSDDEFNAAISNAMLNRWISRIPNSGLSNTLIRTSQQTRESKEEIFLKKISLSSVSYDSLSDEEIKAYQSLRKRPNYIEKKETKNIEIELSQHGLGIVEEVNKQSETERTIDVMAPAPIIFAGRKNPLQDIIDEAREIFVGLGFQEIEGPLVQNSFWNFDALFTPQDHPAREMQDTFYIAKMQASRVADKKILNNVSNIHKKGWGYKWNINDIRRFVLRTHTTSVTIRYLADNKPTETKIFSVGRVFRNEKLTYKHLAEFYQVEGIVVGKNVTLRDLMGLQTEFYYKMGLKKIKFWPSFFPYTEPSLQSMVYHEKLGKWIELFGMGIFRPEVTIPIGIKNPVLAWGGGLERIALLKYELDDVRELYNNKLSWLRSVPKCQ
tara:strand:- start:2475 stop:3938 length:1464 start_codon:yes stop_codon:yes gene_type:complete